jgi:2-oxoglutarate ferredoxin oxidoreductase subunit alpha
MEGLAFSTTGLEHAEDGTPDYTPEAHTAMSDKRLRKLQGALEDLPAPEEHSGGGKIDVGVIAWGSTFGSVLEATNRCRAKGMNVGALKVTSLFPYHERTIRDFMSRSTRVLIPELNHQGQLANLVGHLAGKDVIRFDRATGVPIPPSAIVAEIERLLGAS